MPLSFKLSPSAFPCNPHASKVAFGDSGIDNAELGGRFGFLRGFRLFYVAHNPDVSMRNPNASNRFLLINDLHGRGNRGVLCCTINRPDRRNCLNLATLDALIAALEKTADDPLLITGAGSAFCSGLDLQEIARLGSPSEHLHRLVALLEALSKRSAPTMCYVNGAARAGGVGLAGCADVVAANPAATFKIPGDKIYTPMAAILPPMLAVRRELALDQVEQLAGCLLSAENAMSIGLIDLVCDDQEAAIDALAGGSCYRSKGQQQSEVPTDLNTTRQFDRKSMEMVQSRIEQALSPGLLAPLMTHLNAQYGSKD